MQRIRNYWNAFRNIMIVFSFITNFVLIIVLLFTILLIFQIKNGIAEPLIDGLHSNFVGMDEAEINTVIPVNDTITIDFTLPIDQSTTVVLTESVPLSAQTNFNLGEGIGSITGQVNLNLPVGLELPVQLNMNVPVKQDIPIALMVNVNIPLKDTELHTPFVNLRNLFDPFVRALDNLPSNWEDTPDFVLDAAQGDVNILSETEGSRNPWYSRPDVIDDRPLLGPEEQPTDQTSTGDGQQPLPPTVDPNATPMPTATTVPLVQPENQPTQEAPAGAGELPAETAPENPAEFTPTPQG